MKKVYDVTGRAYRLGRQIHRGGQGAIFEIVGEPLVAKILTGLPMLQRDEISRRYRWLAGKDLGQAFVLPETVLAPPDTGYIMPRVTAHSPLARLLQHPPEQDFSTWYNTQTGGLIRRLNLAARLARSFRTLHRYALAYCDISANNVLVADDPKLDTLVIIDTDNISIPHAATCLVLGTPAFMAPEILRGTHVPDTITDCHSLAVLIFQMLRLGHPLLGDIVNHGPPEREEEALTAGPFVEHPNDNRNASTSLLPSHLTTTELLRRLFARAFVDGLATRTARPTPLEWEEALLTAKSRLAECSYCSLTYIPVLTPTRAQDALCPWCERPCRPYTILQLYTTTREELPEAKPIEVVAPSKDFAVIRRSSPTPLTARILFGTTGEEGDATLATVDLDATDNVVFSNLSLDNVKRSGATGGERTVRPGSRLPLAPDETLRIPFPDKKNHPLFRKLKLKLHDVRPPA